jgi:uncharacterized protein YceK
VKRLITLIVIMSLVGCASMLPKTAESKAYQHAGAKVFSPSDSGWALLNQSAYGVTFAKKYAGSKASAIANTYVFRVGDLPSDEVFFELIKQGRAANDDRSRFKALEVNYESLTYKDLACLKYRGVSEDHGNNGIDSADFLYFKNFGYICRTKLDQSTAILMEVSHRSDSIEVPIELKKMAAEFFNSIELLP